MLEEHQPRVIEDFNGYWKRGDFDSVPIDHFSECNNIQYIESGFRTRDGLDIFLAKGNVVRVYAYNNVHGEGFLVLDNNGNFYHIIPGGTINYLFLHVATANDFKYVAINNFVFITPMVVAGTLTSFVYVYDGEGTTAARKAGGIGPVDADGVMTAVDGATGNVAAGYHVFGVVYETKSGFLTQVGPDTLVALNAAGAKKVNLASIPVSPSSAVVKRHIVATIAINPALYTGNTRGYEFFFVPDGTINDNTSTTLTINFYDEELIADASHLLDLLSEIPCCNAMIAYHGRLVLGNFASNNSLIRISYPGEPEAFDAVNGLQTIPENGFGVTNFSILRDILYVYRINQTFSMPDNNSFPSSWPLTVLDEGIGAGYHGVAIINAQVGGINIEYVMNIDLNGIFIFSGIYIQPEFSWKIWKFWTENLDQYEVSNLSEIMIDVYHKIVYISFPSLNMILFGDFGMGFDMKSIRWGKWTFNLKPTSIALYSRIPQLIMAMN